MEEIQDKAFNDELNKAQEEIQECPKKYIPVPKTNKNKEDYAKEKKNDD